MSVTGKTLNDSAEATAVGDKIREEMASAEMEAGTGFMNGLADTIRRLAQEEGYIENLTAKEDHLECGSGKYKLYPGDFTVDKLRRFENSSDPDDNAILYAISSRDQKIKGIFVENYGINQYALSPEMLERLKEHQEVMPH
jgi:hypothetical protein